MGEVFEKNVPPGTNAELETQNDEYSFLIVLLMRWKLQYGDLYRQKIGSLGKANTIK